MVLGAWFALMIVASVLSLRQLSREQGAVVRSRLTLAGMCFATLSVGSLLLLHLSWISADISQRFGAKSIGILGTILFWSILIGLILSVVGAGKLRFLGVATCSASGAWYLVLLLSSAISMGSPQARHPKRILIPDGYIGWVEMKYGIEKAPALAIQGGKLVCRIPNQGLLETSSHMENGWAKDEYFYYSQGGSTHLLPETGWGMGGLIWGNSVGGQATPDGSYPREFYEFFFVGTEEQFRHAVSFEEGHPFNQSAKTAGHD
jgi:hypothetical protein